MLVNLKPNMEVIMEKMARGQELNITVIPQYYGVWKIERGVYIESYKFNFPHEEFLEYIDIKPEDTIVAYGVADSPDQILRKYKSEIDDWFNRYYITFTAVFQHNDDDWRWGKWGEYIGEHSPQFEYLKDEDFGEDFLYVLCYQIHKLPN